MIFFADIIKDNSVFLPTDFLTKNKISKNKARTFSL